MNNKKTLLSLILGLFLMSFAVYAQAQSVAATTDNTRNGVYTERGQSVYTLSYPEMNRMVATDLQNFENQNSIVSVVVDQTAKTVVIKTNETQVPISKFQGLVDAYLDGKARDRNIVEEAN